MHSCLYAGLIRHRRFTPALRRFQYRLYMTYLDLAELDVAFRGRWLWSATRPAVARFRRRDHVGNPAEPLDATIRSLIEQHTGTRPAGPIRLLTNLASFGYCFNPISLYFCFDERDQRVETVVAEVTNTPWAERHCYVLTADDTQRSSLSFRFDKRLHVSPFLPPDITYAMRVLPPRERLAVHLAAERNGRRLLDATLLLARRPLTGGNLARMLIRYPLQPQRIMAGIHWQALKLWWTGHQVFPHLTSRPAHWELTRT